jgi:serine/threonine protein kinase
VRAKHDPVTVHTSESPGHRVGDLIAGRYIVRAELGRGGTGEVYEVEHVQSGQRLALKTLHARFGKVPELMKRFEREAKATNLLSHPHIVEVLDFGALENGAPFLVMELLRGASLSNLIDNGQVEPARGLRIIRQVLEALTHAHAVGIVHRDLKPDNVMLVTDRSGGGEDFVKLLDFGIAKVVGEAASEIGSDTLTVVGTAFGTPEYMAPEQALGVKTDHRADLYAMGILLFEVLTGRQPFRGPDAMTVARMQVQDRPPTLQEAAPGRGWSDEMERVLAHSLAKLPDERYQSAEEMLAAVDGLIRQLAPAPGGAKKTTIPPPRPATSAVNASQVLSSTSASQASTPSLPTGGRPRPRRVALLAIAAILLAGGGAGAWLLRRSPRPARPAASALKPPAMAKSDLAQRAERMLDSGDARGALELLETGLVPPGGDDDAYGHFLLGHARTIVGNHAEAMTAYLFGLRLSPELLASKILRADLVTILNGKDKTGGLAALELLATQPVPDADELIVEQASRGKLLEVRVRARTLAKQRGLAKRVDELDSYALDLEQGATCARRREAVRKLRMLGKKDAIPALRRAAEDRGATGEQRPNACLEKDALAAIRYLGNLR